MKNTLITLSLALASFIATATPLTGTFSGPGNANFGSVGPTSNSLDTTTNTKTSVQIDNLGVTTSGGAAYGGAMQVQQGGSVTGVGAPATKNANAGAAAATGNVQSGNGASSVGGPSVLPVTSAAESAGVQAGAGKIDNSFKGSSIGGAQSTIDVAGNGATKANNVVQFNPTVDVATTKAEFAGSGNATTIQAGVLQGQGTSNGNVGVISQEGLSTQSLDATSKALNTVGPTTLPTITNGIGGFTFN